MVYQENDWVLLCISAAFRTFLDGWHSEDTLQRYSIVPLAGSNFAQIPCLFARRPFSRYPLTRANERLIPDLMLVAMQAQNETDRKPAETNTTKPASDTTSPKVERYTSGKLATETGPLYHIFFIFIPPD